jgi:hypothetical protein
MPTLTYQCPECGLHYREEVIAKKCEKFCKKYRACSLEITKLSIEANSNSS